MTSTLAYENHAFPVSISEYGKLRVAKEKSEFMQLLHKVIEPQYEEPNVQMKRIDRTTFVNIYRLRTSKTFWKYCDDELVKVVCSFSEGVDRMDFVLDGYLENSIKTQIREGRGKGMHISVRKDTPFVKISRHSLEIVIRKQNCSWWLQILLVRLGTFQHLS